ncbi:MAG: hypothetical protein ABFQ65_00230 [Nanoarchaeota archaeon]
MAERDIIFNNEVKYQGIFNYGEFYKFCYDWLMEETQLDFIAEEKYNEKIEGNKKKIEIKWVGQKQITDFFRFDFEVKFKMLQLEKIEINQGGIKINTNKGMAEIKMKGILVRDYKGKFEKNALQIFLRTAYEKWIIPGRIDQMEGKLFGSCDEFLAQAKAFLDLEGKR